MPRKVPYLVTLEPGAYYWCRCGKSKKQPFCDGSHTGTGKEPLEFKIASTSKEAVCGCGKTKNPPFCDGSHAS